MDARREELRRFIEENCLIRRPGIKLASGRISNYYLDCRMAVMDPRSLPIVAELVLERALALPQKPGALGGAIVGAVPVTAAVVQLSAQRGKPLAGFMVRREVKTHGTQKKIENAPPAGTKVLIVEDVVTTGGSTRETMQAARAAGAQVVGTAAIVDRSGGRSAALDVPLVALFDISLPTYDPGSCPLCASGVPVTKPGSRPVAVNEEQGG